MGFNYAAEKKKFETLWARLRREYRAAGMSDTAIQKMHDFDWEVFKQERIYRLHTQDLGIGIFDEPSTEQEDKSALMKKFLESVSRWDDYTTASRYGWIEGIGDQRLVRGLKRLSISEKELLTKYCIEDKTQQEIAELLNMHRSVYRRYESGEREIPVWAVIKLADYYRVSTDYLLGLTDDPARR